MGQFCDCVLKLHIHPGRLFLAHKSVLAAFSPVLASLLPRHGALVDLNFPYLTPETLDSLLDYIYTGTLPPLSQEEPVLAAALHLQMDQLQLALTCRRKGMAKITNTGKQLLFMLCQLWELRNRESVSFIYPNIWIHPFQSFLHPPPVTKIKFPIPCLLKCHNQHCTHCTATHEKGSVQPFLETIFIKFTLNTRLWLAFYTHKAVLRHKMYKLIYDNVNHVLTIWSNGWAVFFLKIQASQNTA